MISSFNQRFDNHFMLEAKRFSFLVPVTALITSCGFDVQNVNGLVSNADGACDTFSGAVTLVTTLGTTQETFSLGVGKGQGISYANGLGQGTRFSVTATCTQAQRSIDLKGNYDSPERFLGWTVSVVDRNNPRLVPPF